MRLRCSGLKTRLGEEACVSQGGDASEPCVMRRRTQLAKPDSAGRDEGRLADDFEPGIWGPWLHWVLSRPTVNSGDMENKQPVTSCQDEHSFVAPPHLCHARSLAVPSPFPSPCPACGVVFVGRFCQARLLAVFVFHLDVDTCVTGPCLLSPPSFQQRVWN